MKRLKIKFVNQICDKSCVPACLSMLTREPIESIIEKVKIPTHDEPMFKYLKESGLRIVRHKYNKILPNGIYLMSVPSLNVKRVMHQIVVDTYQGRVFDPQLGRPEREAYTWDLLKCWGDAFKVIRKRPRTILPLIEREK